MSRARFADLCRGLSPVERDKLAGQVQLYPDEMPRGWPLHCEIDQERAGAEFERLCGAAEHERQLDEQMPHIAWEWRGHGRGRGSFDPGPPWSPVAAGVWVAPLDTAEPGWVDLDTIAAQMRADAELSSDARRYFLNNVVTEDRSGSVRDLLAVYARIAATVPRQVHAGEAALEAFTAVFDSVVDQVAERAGIPAMLLDPGLPPDVWKIVDPATGEALFEGSVSENPRRHGRVIRDRGTDLDPGILP